MISSEREAGKYIATHFWSGYFDSLAVWGEEYPDTLTGGVARKEFNEAVRLYALSLWSLANGTALKTQRALMSECESLIGTEKGRETYKKILNVLESILYDPVSDFRNEEFYIPVIESRLATGLADSIPLPTYRFRLEKCSLNRTGTKAADFSFIAGNGQRGRLYGIKADYILLMFTNPGCPACRSAVEQIHDSEILMRLVSQGKMQLLNIYIDEDVEAWRTHLGDYPEEWLSGYDDSLILRNGNLYDVRAIPSIYLLDRDKKVMFKDVSLSILIPLLENSSMAD